MSIQEPFIMIHPEQKEGLKRLIDRKWDSVQAIARGMKEAESNAIKFLFTMNGAGILAILTFLGAFHNISFYSFIWVLIGLLFLVTGVLLAAYLILRVMMLNASNGRYLQEHIALREQMLYGFIPYDEVKIEKHSEKALDPTGSSL